MLGVIEVMKYEQQKRESLEEARKYGYTDIVYKIRMAEKIPLFLVE